MSLRLPQSHCHTVLRSITSSSSATRFAARRNQLRTITVASPLSRLGNAAATTITPPQRPFPTSHKTYATITNPRKDADGSEMKIDISPRAVKRLHEIQEKDHNPNLALRITVESGGCHGFQYLMSLSDKFNAEDDTIFDESGAKVVMDEPSLELLKGSKIDYTMELIGSQFKVVDNPLATSSCGCGTSFDIKDL